MYGPQIPGKPFPKPFGTIETVFEENEIKGRPDPGDSQNDMGPANQQVHPFLQMTAPSGAF